MTTTNNDDKNALRALVTKCWERLDATGQSAVRAQFTEEATRIDQLETALRFDSEAATSELIEDPHEIIVPLGECVCYTPFGVNAGKPCECMRVGARRGDANGPRAIVEPCSPAEGSPTSGLPSDVRRVDAVEPYSAVALARATAHSIAAVAWKRGRFDAVPRSASRLAGTVGKVDEATRTVSILASTKAPTEGEVLASWDLSRFLKSPVILWAHSEDLLPIGVASNVRMTPAGLMMDVRFATSAVSPLAEQVYQGVREGIIRGVSVGYDEGEITGASGGNIVRSNNVLAEVSFAPIGLDEDAGIASPAAAERSKRARMGRGGLKLENDRVVKNCGCTAGFACDCPKERRGDAHDDELAAIVTEARRRRDRTAALASRAPTSTPAERLDTTTDLRDAADPIALAKERQRQSTANAHLVHRR